MVQGQWLQSAKEILSLSKKGYKNMNQVFIFVFTFLGLMTLLALYMLVVVL